jgi:hypothetical protein
MESVLVLLHVEANQQVGQIRHVFYETAVSWCKSEKPYERNSSAYNCGLSGGQLLSQLF